MVDLWAPVPFDHLPSPLIEHAARGDWVSVRDDLKGLVDAVTTDGPYGRALLQFVMKAPLPTDPVLERYRASICVDHGDWDGLQRHLSASAVEAGEPVGVRDAILAPLDRTAIPRSAGAHQKVLFDAYEFQFQRAIGRWRHWAQRLFAFHTDVIWTRADIPASRHLRFRRLHDTLALACGELQGGRLHVAQALAREAQSLGDEGEPGRDGAYDIEKLTAIGMGLAIDSPLLLPRRIASPSGPTPLGTFELVFHTIPMYALLHDGTLEWAAELGWRIAVRFGSPRGQFQAQTWRVASAMLEGKSANKSGLPGLLAEGRQAGPGLRVVPLLLHGISRREPGAFLTAERVARSVGTVWAQVSALTWLVALDPQPRAASWLYRLLEMTGWRRPILVPSTVIADAALGLMSARKLGTPVIELAEVGNRPNLIVEVATRHLDDPLAPGESRLAAVDALHRVGTTNARTVLNRLARRSDDVGSASRRALARRALGDTLSEREREVLDLAAHGMTNREIADHLSLSPHTIARHLANARAKLGAANRTEAAVKLEELEVR